MRPIEREPLSRTTSPDEYWGTALLVLGREKIFIQGNSETCWAGAHLPGGERGGEEIRKRAKFFGTVRGSPSLDQEGWKGLQL